MTSRLKVLSATLSFLAVLAFATPARAAIIIWTSEDGLRTIEFSPSLKLFFFGATGFLEAPGNYAELRQSYLDLSGEDLGEWPYPNVGGGMLSRLRLRFSADLTPRIRFVVHYEHRPRVLSNGSVLSAASSALQGDEVVPFRITPLQWTITDSGVTRSALDELVGSASPTFAWDHEIDRLFFSFSLDQVDIVIGRQAVGWGLGRLWAPLDVFAPLTATDLDREERRGIDAVKLTFPFSATSYFEVVAAAGMDAEEDPSWDDSSVAWMLRLNAWSVEWMLMAGKVGRDEVYGLGLSSQIRGVGVRGEVTATHDDADETNVRATVGVEFGTSFNLTGIIEYHYNGFGVLRTGEYMERAIELGSRLSRGGVSGLAQHYLGATLMYQPLADLAISIIYLQNLQDGSLILGPALEYTISDEVRLNFTAMIPIGRDAEWRTDELEPSIRPHSEYGLSPQLYMLQLRVAI